MKWVLKEANGSEDIYYCTDTATQTEKRLNGKKLARSRDSKWREKKKSFSLNDMKCHFDTLGQKVLRTINLSSFIPVSLSFLLLLLMDKSSLRQATAKIWWRGRRRDWKRRTLQKKKCWVRRMEMRWERYWKGGIREWERQLSWKWYHDLDLDWRHEERYIHKEWKCEGKKESYTQRGERV